MDGYFFFFFIFGWSGFMTVDTIHIIYVEIVPIPRMKWQRTIKTDTHNHKTNKMEKL